MQFILNTSNMRYLVYFISSLMLLASAHQWKKCEELKEMYSNGNGFCVCDYEDVLNGWRLYCIKESSDFGVTLQVTYIVDKSLTFECGEDETNYESFLKVLNLNRTQTFVFKSCPLPNVSYAEIFPLNQNHPVEQIKIENKQGDGEFTASLFHNISETLKSLLLNNNGIKVLPGNMFANFSRLKYLSLTDNQLQTLPDNIFLDLHSLEFLELANNVLEVLPENVFQGLFQLEKLYLYKNNLKVLPKNVFKSLVNLKVLDLADNQLTLLSSDIFLGLSQLIHLRLRANWLQTLPEDLFNNTANLQEIDLSINRFMEPLPKGLFYGLSRLENVSIYDCNLTYIDAMFFAQAPNISRLLLQNNGLNFLPESIFTNNTKLKEINLNFNFINMLPEKLFHNQKHLEKLYLFRNNISVIPNDLFQNARNVKILNFGKNHIQSASQAIFSNLPYLETIDLSKNNLTHFGLGQNEHIKYIDLSFNSLTKVPFINWQQHLKIETVKLQNNKITNLCIPVLYSNNRRTINLSNNNIKTINAESVFINDYLWEKEKSGENEETVFQTYISLNSNPFVCDCHLFSFFDYLTRSKNGKKSSVQFSNVQNLTCQEPQILTGKPIIKLASDQLKCDLTENCSYPCKCEVRAQDNARIVNCSNHRLITLPRSVPHNTSILFFQKNMLSHLDGFNNDIWMNLTELYLDNNRVIDLNNFVVPPNLKVLSLHGNRISNLLPSVMDFASNVSSFRLTLSENPWDCNCSARILKKWVTEYYHIVPDVKNIICSKRLKKNDTLERVSLLSISDDDMCPINDWPYKVQMIVVSTVFVILLLLLCGAFWLYYRNKQTVIAYVYIHMHNVFTCFFSEKDIDEDKMFDAFVSYSSSDKDVAYMLIQELENKEPRFRLCIHERNWIAGHPISWNIFNSVHNSRKTILVISKEFLESMWFQVEFHTAYYQMLEDKIDRLIIIVKGELPSKDTLDKELQFLLSTKTYLVWEEKWFWEKLRYAMPHKRQQVLQSNSMALKDRPDSEKIKTVENQIAILSSSNKATDKVQEVVQNGTNRALNLVNKDTSKNNRSE